MGGRDLAEALGMTIIACTIVTALCVATIAAAVGFLAGLYFGG